MSANSETCVEHEDTLLSPGREEATIARWRCERRIVVGQGDIHILEGRRSGGRRPDGEAEAVCLIVIVVGVLT